MESSELKTKLKTKIGRGSFKDFWESHLKDIISYQYFNMQLNGMFRVDDEVKEIIEKYLAE